METSLAIFHLQLDYFKLMKWDYIVVYFKGKYISQQLCKIIGQLVKYIVLFLKIICISNTTPEQFQCIIPFLILYHYCFHVFLKIKAWIPVPVCFFSEVNHSDRNLRTSIFPFSWYKIFKDSSNDTSRSFRVILQKQIQLLKRKVLQQLQWYVVHEWIGSLLHSP